MKKSVLFIMTSMYNGGAEKSLVNLLNELNPDEFDVDLLLLKQKGIFLSQVPEWVNMIDPPKGIQLSYTPESVSGHFGVKLLRLLSNLLIKSFIRRDCYARACRWKYVYGKLIEGIDKEYDIAVAYITGELLYLLCEKIQAQRKLLWVHNDYVAEGQPRDFDLPYMEKMDAIVSISEKCTNVLKDVFPMYEDKIYEIHNITSSAVIKKQSEAFYPSEYAEGKINLVSIGRLEEQKGFDWAIRAAEVLKHQGMDFSWYILGTGSLENKLLRLIKELNVDDVIHLIGARENPYPYIKNADILVQSSRYEGKSVVLDEAKILGVPIVVTNYQTVRDQILDGKEGVIIPMSPEGIASGITSLVDDRDKYNEIKNYLCDNEYGNQAEIVKYREVLTGDFH